MPVTRYGYTRPPIYVHVQQQKSTLDISFAIAISLCCLAFDGAAVGHPFLFLSSRPYWPIVFTHFVSSAASKHRSMARLIQCLFLFCPSVSSVHCFPLSCRSYYRMLNWAGRSRNPSHSLFICSSFNVILEWRDNRSTMYHIRWHGGATWCRR